MEKAKIIITCEVEYEIHPEYYDKSLTLEEMVQLDVKNAEDDPYMFLDMDNAKINVTGSIIKKDKEK